MGRPSPAPVSHLSDHSLRKQPRIGYFTSRFPKLTETFILFEVLGLERAGADVRLYPLLREREKLMHAEAVPVVARARFLPFLSGPIIASQLWWLWRYPRKYLSTIAAALVGTWRSPNFLIGAIGIFPKVAHAAREMVRDGVEHVHGSWATHAALAGFIVKRLTGIPYSFSAHGSDLHVDRTMLCTKVAESAFVVAINEYNRELILQECPAASSAPIEVIHTGIDTDFFRPARQRTSDTFTILAVGSLLEVKGHKYLIEACRLLAEQGLDFRCQVIGEGELREELQSQIASAGLGDRVTLLGARTRAEVAAYYQAADVFVTPSVQTKRGDREGIPVVLMEACASGLPVVASRISGIPELVEDGVSGILVPPNDPTAIAAAVRRLHDEPGLRRAFGAAGQQRMIDDFDVYANAARLCSLFARRAHTPSV